MASSVLLSTLLMGILLLAIAVGLLRAREWQRGPVVREGATLLDRAVHSPWAWTATFVSIALGFGLGTIAVLSDVSIALPTTFWGLLTVFMLPFVLLLAFYVFAGVYASAREHGVSSAPAVGLASTVIGGLVIVAVVAQLIVGGAG